MNEEILAKAKAAKSAEELIELAKANGKEMTAEQAAAIFNALTQSGEITDEELVNTVGGCGGGGGASAAPAAPPVWHPIFDCDVTAHGYSCSYPKERITVTWSKWACKACGNAVNSKRDGTYEYCEHVKQYAKLDCSNCKWYRPGPPPVFF